ncbi:hypothetical protein SCATT_p11060 (plasmid) [Streptantibioticus cattleyicolor NRRL 8057 = DSM 46488]|uniref:Uncharacterized protein n=1 Tax=Streptantibioticus cattleyicolor (strain ATCC 35852 / DSM 46488 / JCM 4925 / NBRC 14057 / NRRL 8057) TaxID=1003195 RepID=G8XEE3_STREN|nr:hypothetical protein SCATT_p11060 [Streptantibioticus cattleyicolor NRRL 8057 = DSM 46488]
MLPGNTRPVAGFPRSVAGSPVAQRNASLTQHAVTVPLAPVRGRCDPRR